MSAPDLLVASDAPDRPLDGTAAESGGRRRGRDAAVGLGALAAGAALVWAALDPLGSAGALVQAIVIVAGLRVSYGGYVHALVAWRGPRVDPALWLCTGWLIVLSSAALLADVLPLAEHVKTSETIAIPGNLRPDLFSGHPLGTNRFGLDLLAQSIYGARVSLATALLAVGLSILIGVLVGIIAGYFRGWTDAAVSVGTDSLISVPPLVLLVALAAVFGVPRTVPEAIVKSGLALAVVTIPTMVRLARATAMVFAQREFVLAGRAMGASSTRVIIRELLPNVMLPVLSYSFIVIAVLIIAEGSLSFLGLGLQQPQPTWGNMIAQADLTVLRSSPHIALVPGAFMFLTVYAFNQVGEHLQQRWGSSEES